MHITAIYIGDILRYHGVLSPEFNFSSGFRVSSSSEEEIDSVTSICKKNAILISVAKHGYVDVDEIHSIVDLFKIQSVIKSGDIFTENGVILSDHSLDCRGSTNSYVRIYDMEPCQSTTSSKGLSIWQLKKILRKNGLHK